jgi:hypothetical protein
MGGVRDKVQTQDIYSNTILIVKSSLISKAEVDKK